MLHRALFRSSLALPLYLLLATGAFAQGYGTVQPYSVQLQALKGQTNTDVYMTFASNDVAKYPLPAALKKLQLKIRNAAGEVVFLHNEKALALSGSQLVSSVTGVNQHNQVEIQAHLKTSQTKNEEIVRGTVVAQLRPDLQVLNVVAPEEVKVSQPFQVEAVIHETNLEVGAVCEVALYDGATLVRTVPGVSVPAGGTVSVVFQGLSHPVVETRAFSVVIGNAVPGEYSTANNTHTFSVSFTNPVVAQSMYYGLQYYGYRNYDYHYIYSYGGNTQTYDEVAPQMESFSYWAYAQNPAILPSGAVESVSFRIDTEDGIFRQYSASSLTPSYEYSDPWNNYSYRQYSIPVPDSKLNAYVWEYTYGGYTEVGVQVYQWAANRVYVSTYNGAVQYEYTETTPTDWFINADQELRVSTLLTYGNTAFGGGATLAIAPYQHYAWADAGSYWDYYWGLVSWNHQQTYDYTYNYGNGYTDPNLLPKPSAAGNELAGTEPTDELVLGQNSPNPFNPSTTIRYSLPAATDVRLTVYNVVGQQVRVLVAEGQQSGPHSVEWDGRDAVGQVVANGPYLYRLEAGGRTAVQKMLFAK